MGATWTDQAGTSTTDRLTCVDKASLVLSDGTLVFLDYDGSSTVYLKWTSDRSTLNTIASWNLTSSSANPISTNTGIPQALALCRDSSDNLYVVGASFANTSEPAVQGYTKGSGHTWTQQTTVVGTSLTGVILQHVAAYWANTGGGTGSHGHLVALYRDSGGTAYWASFDAGVALAGSGSVGPVNSATIWTVTGSSGSTFEIEPDGFGSTAFMAGGVLGASTAQLKSGTVNSSGTLATTTTFAALTTATWTGTSKLRIIRVSSGTWGIVYPSSSSAGHWMVASYSTTAQLSAGVDSGTLFPFNQSGGLQWDAYCDPDTASQLWVLSCDNASAGSVQMRRTSATVGGSVTWAGASTADDTLSVLGTATPTNVRCVKQPGNLADWDVFVQTGSTNYQLDGDHTLFASAPSAPTLTSPANNAYLDASGGVTFQSTYNSTDTYSENAYALRYKLSGGGSYSYWNGTAWQGTVAWPAASVSPGGTTSVGPISSGPSNGHVYNWSMASQEALASLQGPFATDFTFTAQAAPTLTVTGPTGTVVTTNQPTVTWTTTPASGALQTAYEVIVEHGSYGTTPGSGTQDWDSGTVTSGLQQAQIAISLTNGVTYRAFVRVTETGGITSTWQYVTFTLNLDLPATPTVTATAGTDPATGCPRVALVIQGHDNLLTADDASMEGTIGSWSQGPNWTITRSTTYALDGAASLKCVRNNTTAGNGYAINAFATVAPSSDYTCMVAIRGDATSTGKQYSLKVQGQVSGVYTTKTVTLTSSGFLVVPVVVTTSNSETGLQLIVNDDPQGSPASGQIIYVDCAGIFPGDFGYELTVLTDSPAAYWRLAEGTGVFHDSAGGFDGARNGGITVSPYPLPTYLRETASQFDGTSGFVSVANEPSVRLGSAFSIECFFDGGMIASGFPTLMALGDGSGTGGTWQVYATAGGGGNNSVHLKAGLSGGGTFDNGIASIGPGPMYHLVITYSGTTLTFYLNGAQVAQYTGVSLSLGTDVADSFRIGATSAGSYWPNALAQVAIYNTALSAARVLAHYNAATQVGSYAQWWSRGGLVGSTTAAVLRSDGVYVRTATTANPVSIPAGSQQVIVYDYEAIPGKAYTYKASVSAVV